MTEQEQRVLESRMAAVARTMHRQAKEAGDVFDIVVALCVGIDMLASAVHVTLPNAGVALSLVAKDAMSTFIELPEVDGLPRHE